jgi:AraC-like DNA-binding protein
MLYNFEDLSYSIFTIDRFYHKEGSFKVKARPYAALSYREGGTGTFRIGDKIFVTNPGDIIFIPENTPYEVEYSVSESIVAHLKKCNYKEAEMFGTERSEKVPLLFYKMLDEWRERHSQNSAKATIYTILDKLADIKERSCENNALLSAISYIEKNFSDPKINIESVSAFAFVSPSSLGRYFEKSYGVSPKQYIIKLRLNKALSLLIEGNLSVKEIALECGFSDEKYFSRAFKRKYGYPPSKLRDKTVL